MRINFNKIICINLKSANQQQLLAICETYLFSFEGLCKDKIDGVNTVWLDSQARYIAYTFNDDVDRLNMGKFYKDVVKKDYDRIRDVKPVKTPKFPRTDQALNNYIAYLKEGYDVQIPAIDSLIVHKIKEQERYKELQKLPVVLELDAILDKINKYGMSSITEDEKNFLDNLK